jgi:transcription initiation factor IIE alpha subunit
MNLYYHVQRDLYLRLKQVDHQLKIILEKGPRKVQILKALERAKEPLGSETISNELQISKTNVIRILNGLEQMKAIECVTGRKRDRRFKITDKGKYHLSLVK